MGQNNEIPDKGQEKLITILFIFIIFFILLFLPFIPGIIELLKPRDAAPLFINKNYTKDPRYFGKSFRYIIENALSTGDLSSGVRKVKLSKNEDVEIAPYKKIYAGKEGDNVFYITGDFVSTEKARFNKEIYVKGDAVIGSENTLRALACTGKVLISEKSNIIRWVDGEKGVDIGIKCNLGISISSGGILRISKHCSFKRLYGLPIITTSNINSPIRVEETDNNDESFESRKKIEEISDISWVIDEKQAVIPPFARIEGDFIVRKGLTMKENCVLNGSIKTYGDLIIGKDVKVSGNLFSEGNIEIGEGTLVMGNIFSQGTVHIRERVKIGSAEKFKSVIGKKGIVLEQNVIIYGYIMTEGTGTIL